MPLYVVIIINSMLILNVFKVSGPVVETLCVFQCIKKYHKC